MSSKKLRFWFLKYISILGFLSQNSTITVLDENSSISHSEVVNGAVVGLTNVSCSVFMQGYLLAGYYYTATQEYDIKWTMPQCVLTLKLIGEFWLLPRFQWMMVLTTSLIILTKYRGDNHICEPKVFCFPFSYCRFVI